MGPDRRPATMQLYGKVCIALGTSEYFRRMLTETNLNLGMLRMRKI